MTDPTTNTEHIPEAVAKDAAARRRALAMGLWQVAVVRVAQVLAALILVLATRFGLLYAVFFMWCLLAGMVVLEASCLYWARDLCETPELRARVAGAYECTVLLAIGWASFVPLRFFVLWAGLLVAAFLVVFYAVAQWRVFAVCRSIESGRGASDDSPTWRTPTRVLASGLAAAALLLLVGVVRSGLQDARAGWLRVDHWTMAAGVVLGSLAYLLVTGVVIRTAHRSRLGVSDPENRPMEARE